MQYRLEEGKEELQEGLDFLLADREQDKNGEILHLIPKRWEAAALEVKKDGGTVTISYREKAHFFRGLGILLLHKEQEKWTFRENVRFSSNGMLLDCSRNAVPNVENIGNWLRNMAWLGMNCIFLYMEDTYEVAGDPYFGMLRGRYTKEELRQMDDLAYSLGIEMIPCIQTLGHLRTPLRYPVMEHLRDTPDVLMVGEEEVYAFLESCIQSIASCIRSRKIHIGMDEAMGMGQGNYLKKHGVQDRLSLMKIHMDRVNAICRRYGLEPMVWSDMYIRSVCGGEYYGEVAKEDFAEELRPPKDVSLVYWDYYHTEKETYEKYLKLHEQLSDKMWFAGGAWTWNGISPNYTKAFATTKAALEACTECGTKRVFCTIWQDNGAETPAMTGLPVLVLFAEAGFGETPCWDRVNTWVNFLCQSALSDIFLLDGMDATPWSGKGNQKERNPSKYLFYQDIMLGLFDGQIRELPVGVYYRTLEMRLANAKDRAGKWKPLFAYYEMVAGFLGVKAELGLKAAKAYREKDLEKVDLLIRETIPECISRLEEVTEQRRQLWLRENKIFGYEVIEMRLGALKTRLYAAKRRLQEWRDGTCEILPEFEEEHLVYAPGGQELCTCPLWEHVVSPGNLTGV